MKVLLVSTYGLGHQPFGLASPAAWLAETGADVNCLGLAVDSLDGEAMRAVGLNATELDLPKTLDAPVNVPCLSEPWYCCPEPSVNRVAEFQGGKR